MCVFSCMPSCVYVSFVKCLIGVFSCTHANLIFAKPLMYPYPIFVTHVIGTREKKNLFSTFDFRQPPHTRFSPNPSYVYWHTRIRARIHTHAHTCIRAHAHMYTHARTYTHTHARTYMRTDTPPRHALPLAYILRTLRTQASQSTLIQTSEKRQIETG